MARPKKKVDQRRNRLGQFRMTADEELSVKMNAAASGLTVAEFTRRRVLGLIVTPPAAKADAALIAEVNRIGVNVNQIAFALNAGRDYKGDWDAVYDEVCRVLDKVATRYDP